MKKRPPKQMIGWRETVSLPELGLTGFAAKIDTGARTTALHATDITINEHNGKSWVEFRPDHGRMDMAEACILPVLHFRPITNTGGIPEERIIVTTLLKIGAREERVEISLSDRADMKFPMIVGRTALRILRLTVDPSRSWLHSPKPLTQKET